jgi:hypothetical protein
MLDVITFDVVGVLALGSKEGGGGGESWSLEIFLMC